MEDKEEHMAMATLFEKDFNRLQFLLHEESKPFNIQELTVVMTSLRTHLKDQRIREKLEDNHVKSLSVILYHCTDLLNKRFEDSDYTEEDVLNCVTESYRCLRNSCVSCQENQNLVTSHPSCIHCTKTLLTTMVNQWIPSDKSNRELCLSLLRCAVQFLGNYVSGHFENGKRVWHIFCNCFRDLFQCGDTTLTQYTCMLIHSAISGQLCHSDWRQQLASSPEFVTVIENIVTEIANQDFDWGIFVLEDAMQVDQVFKIVMEKLKLEYRILLLEVLINQLKNISDDELEAMTGVPCLETLLYVCSQVVDNSYNVLILASQDTDRQPNMEPELIVKEIEVLGLATSFHHLYPELQEQTDLLICCVYLLDSVHKLGQVEGSVFSPVLKMMDEEADQNHPVFGLKRDLIRIIGNMCYKHKANQDKVRDMNGIPLILDQTAMDKKNPFITQWAILAIRNLCIDNHDSKAVLADLKRQGLASNTSVLQEFGLEAELRGDKIYVRSPERQGEEVEGEEQKDDRLSASSSELEQKRDEEQKDDKTFVSPGELEHQEDIGVGGENSDNSLDGRISEEDGGEQKDDRMSASSGELEQQETADVGGENSDNSLDGRISEEDAAVIFEQVRSSKKNEYQKEEELRDFKDEDNLLHSQDHPVFVESGICEFRKDTDCVKDYDSDDEVNYGTILSDLNLDSNSNSEAGNSR